MKNRLVKELSKQKAGNDTEKSISDEFRYYLEKGDFEGGINLANKITK